MSGIETSTMLVQAHDPTSVGAWIGELNQTSLSMLELIGGRVPVEQAHARKLVLELVEGPYVPRQLGLSRPGWRGAIFGILFRRGVRDFDRPHFCLTNCLSPKSPRHFSFIPYHRIA